ncbi:TRIM3-like protein [Mya arenaria]|uniref:TRIM3-like protein n=1 Tax=Mya arenaria TaxID=6604 RepID=A0ABY7G546_MYAAR|nr:TRIM3-like protein [Mya arenaria]
MTYNCDRLDCLDNLPRVGTSIRQNIKSLAKLYKLLLAKSTMASSKTNDLLHCSICLEKFQQPRALPCLHTFCHLCLQEFIDTSARKGNLSSGFECPVCRRETLPDVKGGQDRGHHEQWAQLFPINHLIMTLLDEYKGPSTEVYDKHRPLGKSDKSSTVPGFVKDSEPIKNIPVGVVEVTIPTPMSTWGLIMDLPTLPHTTDQDTTIHMDIGATAVGVATVEEVEDEENGEITWYILLS